MKISKSISSKIIKDFLELKSLISKNPPANISNKFHKLHMDECVEIINKEANIELKCDTFEIGYINCTITISQVNNNIRNIEIIGAKNIITALILEGYLNIDSKVLSEKSIKDYMENYNHEKFVHVPESLSFLSSEIVYEDKTFYVVFIKEIEMFKAFKI